MIEVRNASKIIKKKTVLQEIHLRIDGGKIYGIYGVNGCGKTMLLRLLCGLIQPTTGEVVCEEGTTFGVIIENPGFLFHETAFENLNYLAGIRKKIGKSEILEALDAVGLLDSKDIKVKKYSLGMLQKLSIAQAIMEKPKVLLLDEPFNALDEESVKRVKKLLRKAKEDGAAVILVSHDLSIIREECDCTIQMENGRIAKIQGAQ